MMLIGRIKKEELGRRKDKQEQPLRGLVGSRPPPLLEVTFAGNTDETLILKDRIDTAIDSVRLED
jgi:hypothetical protein